MDEVDVTSGVMFPDDVVSGAVQLRLDKLRQHLDKRGVGVIKQRHLADKIRRDITEIIPIIYVVKHYKRLI